MFKIRLLFLLGIALIILHVFPGFPGPWKSAISFVIGILVSLFTFLHYKEMKKKYTMKAKRQEEASVFVENGLDNR